MDTQIARTTANTPGPNPSTPRLKRWDERLLRALSRDPSASDLPGSDNSHTDGDPLRVLNRVYPNFQETIEGRQVLDFGCGAAQQVIAMAELGAMAVVGIDSNPRILAEAMLRVRESAAADRIRILDSTEKVAGESFDVVLSQNSMEHFPDPEGVLHALCALLAPGGKLLITFGRPWYAPYGAHMDFFTRLPWVHLLFPESTVMRVRSLYRNDGARRYEDVEGGLNRMSVSRFERLVAATGLEVTYRHLEFVKQLSPLGHLPGVREFFINHLSYELRAPVTGR